MTLNYSITKDGYFYCPKCEEKYSVSYRQLPARDSDRANCGRCGEVMATWNSTTYPAFERERVESGESK